MAGFGRAVQASIFGDGARGRMPVVPSSYASLEAAAAGALSPEAFAYLAGAAGAETTTSENRAALDRWRIVPRIMRDVGERDLSIELFGRRYPTPLLAAPIGALSLAHREADLGIARAAASLGIPYIASNQASIPLEAAFGATPGAPHWFQLYWSSSDALVASLVGRAEAAGAEAIVVTLDTHLLGWRPRDLDLGYLPFAHGLGIAQYTSDPVFQELVRARVASRAAPERGRITIAAIRTLLDLSLAHPGSIGANLRSPIPRAAVDTFLEVFSRSTLTWPDLASLRSLTSLPILVKGIQHPDDARLALAHGADGIIVSNHGGRQLDGAIGSADALPAIVREVAGRAPVLFDSGVRSGRDVLVALALGASAVLVGRPWVYGLAVDGARGAETVLRALVAELDISMGVAGVRSVVGMPGGTVIRRP
ncbi:alpha-hydroxy-acid oxidizing protein [Galbitalea soli]|uniref:Lactate 2-monooxygenase n=1 Tax=Galbitalea soli TaxID=1268042 RepID=A0A7C9TN97_9MICO|nr:alpha-hydroxy-acid oxidizing protein [Galbitalea soli]NEM90038.1 lactate 2-monooxygenase [Galbitalea soli]NYJ30745.1 isopentenyl diphosphate isomerase/L-lactate dehydrogenase-like FMN-dependent dehydrogenase [Galbitalea soli]